MRKRIIGIVLTLILCAGCADATKSYSLDEVESVVASESNPLNEVESAVASVSEPLNEVESAIASESEPLNVVESAVASESAPLNGVESAVASDFDPLDDPDSLIWDWANIDGVASWAIDDIRAAFRNFLITEEMNGNWTQPTNRIAAAEAIARLFERAFSTSINFFAEQMEFDSTDVFLDTTNKYVNFLKQAGISNGVGENRYDPEGTFTLAQMTTMLGRMAKNIFGVDIASFLNGSSQFTDIPSWADAYVGWAIAIGITSDEAGRFDSNMALQNQHTGVFASRAFSYFDTLKHETLRTGELRRTGKYITAEQMEKLKADALSWQSVVSGTFANGEIVAIEAADGSGQQIYFGFRRRFDQDRSIYVIDNDGYEKFQIIAPDGVQAQIIYATMGAGSGEIHIGFKFVSEDSEWIEDFYAFTFENYKEHGRWENRTLFMHQLYLRNMPDYMQQFYINN